MWAVLAFDSSLFQWVGYFVHKGLKKNVFPRLVWKNLPGYHLWNDGMLIARQPQKILCKRTDRNGTIHRGESSIALSEVSPSCDAPPAEPAHFPPFRLCWWQIMHFLQVNGCHALRSDSNPDAKPISSPTCIDRNEHELTYKLAPCHLSMRGLRRKVWINFNAEVDDYLTQNRTAAAAAE